MVCADRRCAYRLLKVMWAGLVMAAQIISGRFDRAWRNIVGAVCVRTNQDRSLFEQLHPANARVTTDDRLRIGQAARRQSS
jgi:hypothetical protein